LKDGKRRKRNEKKEKNITFSTIRSNKKKREQWSDHSVLEHLRNSDPKRKGRKNRKGGRPGPESMT
jgi:hypothetical protein